MEWLIVKNDLIRNKAINLALLLFITFSAGLSILSVVTAVQTFTSISEFYRTAQPPHFVQMHKGEILQEEIDSFMSGYDGLTYWQTQTMIDVYGESLTVVSSEHTYNLSDIRLDIGMVRQNEIRDVLLNSEHEKVTIGQGEVGIPILLKEEYGMQIGDRVLLTDNDITKEFVIKEFILDSMMNSTMASSTRILLSDEDFEMLKGQVGEHEYLIEAYLTNSKEASDFQTAYENAGLPQNGQAVTYTIIFILSALTDIITVFVLLLVSTLLIIVAFICARFTIMAALEEDIREIGTMKAIGIPFSDIRDLYLTKYKVLALAGVIAGYTLAMMVSGVFTKHISTTFGNMRLSPLTVVISLLVALLVYLLIQIYCKRLLKKIKKVTVVEAVVSGTGLDKNKGVIKNGLYRSKILPVNWLLGLREVFYQFKNWITIFTVVLLAVLMILLPINLLNTFEAPEFITYMGSSMEDIMIEVDNGGNLESNYTVVKQVLENDDLIETYSEYRRVLAQTMDVENEQMNLHIDVGNQSGDGLQYLSGQAPETENEIGISYLNADKMGKSEGDTIVLYFDDNQKEFIISGIYQDVTSGGYTAKAKYDFSILDAEKYTFSVNLINQREVGKKVDEWTKSFGAGVSVDPMDEYINQTLGGVVKQLRTIVLAIVVVGTCLAILITILFLKLRLARDLSEIAVLKAVGFSNYDIQKQYLIKIGCVSLFGILAGIFLTAVLGETVVNTTLSVAGIGIKRVELISNPVIEYILCPILLLGVIVLVTWSVVRAVRKYNIISLINE